MDTHLVISEPFEQPHESKLKTSKQSNTKHTWNELKLLKIIFDTSVQNVSYPDPLDIYLGWSECRVLGLLITRHHPHQIIGTRSCYQEIMELRHRPSLTTSPRHLARPGPLHLHWTTRRGQHYSCCYRVPHTPPWTIKWSIHRIALGLSGTKGDVRRKSIFNCLI